jgi:hypothetical protein
LRPCRGKSKRRGLALAAVDGAKPANEVEAMLAVQMAATHDLAMRLPARTVEAKEIIPFQASGNLAIKLLRTFTAQTEALARLRRKEQVVRVEHVTVYPGGQACGAKTRKGTPCQSPPVTGKSRCRMHGGAEGSGAPPGSRNGAYRHGMLREKLSPSVGCCVTSYARCARRPRPSSSRLHPRAPSARPCTTHWGTRSVR